MLLCHVLVNSKKQETYGLCLPKLEKNKKSLGSILFLLLNNHNMEYNISLT